MTMSGAKLSSVTKYWNKSVPLTSWVGYVIKNIKSVQVTNNKLSIETFISAKKQ
jgi:hypothetical protein